MIDIRLVRESPQIIEKNLKKRNNPELIEMLSELRQKDDKWRKILKENEDLRKKRNVITKQIAEGKREGKDVKDKIKQAEQIPKKIKENEESLKSLRDGCDRLLLSIPNLLHESVPEGKDDSENIEIRKWGTAPKGEKSHEELLLDLGLLDLERASKVSGSGFYYMKGSLALLDYSLQRFAIDFLSERGFMLIEPPYMIKRKPYEGVTSLEDFENVMYKIEGDDLYLIATSEHSVAAMMMDTVILEENLPLKVMGISPCFRKEVGSHGKYTRGLFRVHQFNKIEQFVFSHPDDSWKIHEELQKNSEDLYKKLEIPHRIVNVCTGDIGIIAAKKYDTEALMADGVYREVGSNSNCTDYQARRLNIKYKDKEGAPAKGYIHTLNNTALATSRTMVALIEAHQQSDGTVKVPKALKGYMKTDILEPLKKF